VNRYNRIVNSIRNRGLKRSIDIILSAMGDWVFDMKYGTDTMRCVNLDVLDINSENRQRGERYEPTRERPFRRLMKVLDFPSDGVFVDFGSGKGRILMMASDYHFKRIVGVDFSPRLCEIARRNIAIYQNKVGDGSNIEVIESDVVDYEVKSDENIFFMFNPFDSVVMNKVLGNIRMSFEKRNRKIWLIYNDPACHGVVESQRDIFAKAAEYMFGGYGFFVYVSPFPEHATH
jgi:hypothetical protein